MNRVPIGSLTANVKLQAPMYDRSGRLLLARGGRLTEEMILSLLRGGVEHVYLGEWNPEEVRLLETPVPISDYRGVAERMAYVLQSQVETNLKDEPTLEVEPEGEPLEESVDQSVQAGRSESRLREWHAAHHDGIAFLDDVLKGDLENDRVAETAAKVVAKLTDSLTADRSLFLNLTTLKSNAQYLYYHSFNVSVLVINIASALRFNRHQVMEAGLNALFHDLGMAMVPQDIVNAPRQLTESEFLDVQKHSLHVLYAIERFPGLPWTARYTGYQNHERCDGSGYPRMNKQQFIHRFARIVSVADVYDALTSDRPWRPAYHPYRAMEHIVRRVPKKLFDGEAVRGLLTCLSLFPLGSLVRLNTGEIAKVIHSNGEAYSRPVVSVLYDANGHLRSQPETIDLLQEERLDIESFVEGDMGIGLTAGF